jgi:hypothetical protein
LRRIAAAASAKGARHTLIVEYNPEESRAMAEALERAGFSGGLRGVRG